MSTPFYAPGRYVCEMTDQALGKASTGTAQIVWRFRVLETETGDQLAAQYERTIYRSVTDKTMPYVLEDLRTLGFNRDSFAEIDPSTPGYQSFKGVQFTAFCTHEEDQRNGGWRERWGIANSGAFEVTPLEKGKVRELDALFGKQLKTLKTGAAPPRQEPVAQPVTSEGISDDDVPF